MSGGPHGSTTPLQGQRSSELPTGIKVLAALNVIGAVLALPFAAKIFTISHPLAGVLGVAMLAFVGAGLVFTYGLVTLRYWGWLGTVGFNVLGGLLDLFEANVFGVIISGVIVVYLLGKRDLYAGG